jgi:hypothetical protein
LRRCSLLIATTEIGPIGPVGTIPAATTMTSPAPMHSETILTTVTLVVAVSRILLRLSAARNECR